MTESSPRDDLQIVGKVIHDRYRILRRISTGGFGTVYLAENIAIRKQIAIKFLSREMTRDSNFSQNFLDEARAQANLRHPNIVEVFDFYDATGDLTPHFVMDYMPNGSLRDRLKAGKRYTPKEATDFVDKITSALMLAHSSGFIHRDIKPSNILFDSNDEPHIADFGIAKQTNPQYSSDSQRTELGQIKGSPPYMSPEQASAAPQIDPRSDQYSFAIVLYQMLTGGHEPYLVEARTGTGTKSGDAKRLGTRTYQTYIQAHVGGEPIDIRKVREDLPPSLSNFFYKAFAKDPEQRFATMDEFARKFRQAANQRLPISGPLPIIGAVILLALVVIGGGMAFANNNNGAAVTPTETDANGVVMLASATATPTPTQVAPTDEPTIASTATQSNTEPLATTASRTSVDAEAEIAALAAQATQTQNAGEARTATFAVELTSLANSIIGFTQTAAAVGGGQTATAQAGMAQATLTAQAATANVIRTFVASTGQTAEFLLTNPPPSSTRTPSQTPSPTNTTAPTFTATLSPADRQSTLVSQQLTAFFDETSIAKTQIAGEQATFDAAATATAGAVTNTPSPSPTRTQRPTTTPSPTNTVTRTPSPTRTLQPTTTPSPTRTSQPTNTPSPTRTPIPTKTSSPTPSPTSTPSLTPTLDATATPNATPTSVLPESGGSVSHTNFAEDNFGGWTYDPANLFTDEVDGSVLLRLGGDSTTMEYTDASRLALPYTVEVDFRMVTSTTLENGADLSVSVNGEAGYSLAAVSVVQETVYLISGSDEGIESLSRRIETGVGTGWHTLQFEVTAERVTTLLDGHFVDTMPAQLNAGDGITMTANVGSEVDIGGMRVVTPYSTTFADENDLDQFEFPEGAITLEETEDGLDVARVNAPDGFVVFSLKDSENWLNYVVHARVQIEQLPTEATAQEISLLTRINAEGAYTSFLHVQGGAAGLLYQSATTGEVTLQAPVQFDSTLATGQWYDLQVQVAGNVISYYLDGKLIGETRQANPAFGRIGFAVAPGAVVLLDEVRVTPVTTLVVQDNFDNPVLEGWNFTPNGAVTETQADDRTVVRLGSTELVGFGTEENPVINNLDTFSVSFDLQFDAQATGSGELFVTLQRPDGTLYSIVLTLPAQSMGLGDESGQLLASGGITIARGEWHEVHIDVLPDRIDTYWDGFQVFTSTDLATRESDLTFSVPADEVVYLDNIVVAEIIP